MTAKDAIKQVVELSDMVMGAYVGDLKDEELLVRSVPGSNHIAWQLGHVISSEHAMLGMLGHRQPTLPVGFSEAHSAEAAASDSASGFLDKDSYMSLLGLSKQAVLAAIDATPEPDLEKPGPEPMRAYAPTIGQALSVLGTHRMMHAGQFVPIRRKLGKAPLF